MTAFQTLLAATIILAIVVQIMILILLYRAIARFTAKATSLMQTVEPHVNEVSSGLRSVIASINSSSDQVRATVAAIHATAEDLGALAQRQGREVARLVDRTTAMAERQAEETERMLDQARHRISDLAASFDRSVFEPIRALVAVVQGVRKGVDALSSLRTKRPPASEATSDVGSP